jgi:uncharacterized protein YdeI (YjbR/CyaY-like superfamily)
MPIDRFVEELPILDCTMNNKVDQFLEKATRWKQEMVLLRGIVLENKELNEDYKWMHPCYTLQGKNVVLIHGFKDYCALLFHKGALLKDTEGLLIQQTENVQSARQLRFTGVTQVKQQKNIIKDYIKEAIAIERSGRKVSSKETKDFPMPEEFHSKLEEIGDLKNSFYALTPGRQRVYLFYFSQAKQSKTRAARVEKYITKILDGKGMDD